MNILCFLFHTNAVTVEQAVKPVFPEK
jgi:hypothetical protein